MHCHWGKLSSTRIPKMNVVFVLCFFIWTLPLRHSKAYDYDEGYYDYDDYNQTDYEEESNDRMDKPDFVTKSRDWEVSEGAKLSLACQVNDLGNNLIIWTKSPGLLGPEDQLYIGNFSLSPSPRRRLQPLPHNQGSILNIVEVELEDEGTYSCKIAHNSYNQSLTFRVELKDKTRSARVAKGRAEATDKPTLLIFAGAALLRYVACGLNK